MSSQSGRSPPENLEKNPARAGTNVSRLSLFTYILDHDVGFAPNPFFKVCTLAACKPKIRKRASVGDYIIGTGSARRGRAGALIYWMYVEEVSDFDTYWSEPSFLRKRPVMNGSMLQRHGDNIYHRDLPTGQWIQEDSFHSEPRGVISVENLKRDTDATDRVLMGTDYCYWGGSGPFIPQEFSEFVHSTQGHKCKFPPERVELFVDWLRGSPERGYVSDPTDWPA